MYCTLDEEYRLNIVLKRFDVDVFRQKTKVFFKKLWEKYNRKITDENEMV